MKLNCLVAAAVMLVSGQAVATEKMYGTVGVTYNDAEYTVQEADGVGYNFAVGHQFHPQWYLEAGFLQLVDKQDDNGSITADALYLAVLGKAGSIQGELYYKLGIAKTDILGVQAPDEMGGCPEGELQFNACQYDEGIAAGMIGIGYDYHVGLRSMIRFDYTFLIGKDDFKTHVATLGFRYNFN